MVGAGCVVVGGTLVVIVGGVELALPAALPVSSSPPGPPKQPVPQKPTSRTETEAKPLFMTLPFKTDHEQPLPKLALET
jgi:hypothetical protein